MLTTTKPPRCKHCKQRTDAIGRLIHDACIDPWLASERARRARERERQAKVKVKVDRALLRQFRAANPRIPDLIKAAQKEFNGYIRKRDSGKPCICCGAPLDSGAASGGGYDCGHYRSTGSAPHLRFDERNAHGQRKVCNRWGAGRAVDYRSGLVARIGNAAVEALESDNRVHKWTREELIAIKNTYRAKRKALESISVEVTT